jgi:hypothetical protein
MLLFFMFLIAILAHLLVGDDVELLTVGTVELGGTSGIADKFHRSETIRTFFNTKDIELPLTHGRTLRASFAHILDTFIIGTGYPHSTVFRAVAFKTGIYLVFLHIQAVDVPLAIHNFHDVGITRRLGLKNHNVPPIGLGEASSPQLQMQDTIFLEIVKPKEI